MHGQQNIKIPQNQL